MINNFINRLFNIQELDMDDHLKNIRNLYLNINDLRLNNKGNENFEWLNFGYWKNDNNVSGASKALIDIVCEVAGVNNGQVILDVGFGYGLQDFYLIEKYPSLSILGINIMKEQVEFANKLLRKVGKKLPISFQHGNAIDIKSKSAYFDKVLAVECALHFNTREAFLKEAYRVLKPGGSLCLADCLPLGIVENDDLIMAFDKLGVPKENLYGIDKYVKLLENCGFKEIYVRDISEWVLPYAHFFYDNLKNRENGTIDLIKSRDEGLDSWRNLYYPKTSVYYYYIIKATK